MSVGLALLLPSKQDALLSLDDWRERFAPGGEAAARSRANEAGAEHKEAVRSASYGVREFDPVYRPSGPALPRVRSAARAWKLEAGLSNAAYSDACAGTRFLEVTLTPARVKFTFFDPINLKLSPAPSVGGKRGQIREMSPAARDRLADRAAVLDAEGHVPQCMITLTSPANWEQIYLYDADGVVLDGGPLFKSHLTALKLRLGRFLGRMGISAWSCLWFLEFQKRGAPHAHLMLFDCNISEPVRRALRSWVARAWSDIVGNPSKKELAKHRNAGTQVAKMRCKHFGYAKKYASKLEQKEVPDGFRRVGRFWGCWNYKSPTPIVISFDFSVLNAEDRETFWSLVSIVSETVRKYSPFFVKTRLERVRKALDGPCFGKFGFTVFGAAASEAVHSFAF